MKKIYKIVIIFTYILLFFFMFLNESFASNVDFKVNKEEINMEVGETTTFIITANEERIFNIFSKNEDILIISDTNFTNGFSLKENSKTITIKAIGTGTAKIGINATYNIDTSDGIATQKTETKEITINIRKGGDKSISGQSIPNAGSKTYIIVFLLIASTILLTKLYVKIKYLKGID